MPQMKPMVWLSILIMMLILISIMIIYIYFNNLNIMYMKNIKYIINLFTTNKNYYKKFPFHYKKW